jgi:hypothetical protein
MAEKIVFVSLEKFNRAKDALALVLGNKVPVTPNEVEVANSTSKLLVAGKIDPKDADAAVKFLYEKFGGLIRTEAEEAIAQEKKKEAIAKGKKKAIE